MRMWKSFLTAISMYSKLPVPGVKFDEDAMRYVMAFFPVAGLLCAAGVLLVDALFVRLFGAEETFALTLIRSVIPVMVTGGIHLDGFMDTQDALCSYREKEKRLEILKDPHVGAFAVISLAVYAALYVAFLSPVKGNGIYLYAAGFVLSRIFSGLSVELFPKAKTSGTVERFALSSAKQVTVGLLFAELVLCLAVMARISAPSCIAVLACALVVFLYYRFRSLRSFGGITGDLAGWFLCLCELSMLMATAVSCALGWIS